jgi:hypothetical protein
MAYSRSRTTTGPPYVGSRTTLSSGAAVFSSTTSSVSTCADVVGNPNGDNVLSIEHRIREPTTLSGQILNFPVWRFNEYAATDQAGFAHLAVPGVMPSIVDACTEVAARTNPSRPSASLPNFLWEMRDSWKEIPELLQRGLFPYVRPNVEFEIKGRRRKWIKRHKRGGTKSRNSLAMGEFGHMNLIRDLIRLLDFHDSVNARVIELNKLYEKGGLKRKRTVFSSTAKSSAAVTFHSSGASLTGNRQRATTKERWVTIRWRPDSPDIPDASERLAKARQVVHGWDFSSGGIAATLWEAMPWSWLIDYTTNVGNFLNASRNSVGASPANLCVMTETITDIRDNVTGGSSGITGKGGRVAYITRERVLGSIALSARLPFLSNKQLLTLSSIVQGHHNLERGPLKRGRI